MGTPLCCQETLKETVTQVCGELCWSSINQYKAYVQAMRLLSSLSQYWSKQYAQAIYVTIICEHLLPLCKQLIQAVCISSVRQRQWFDVAILILLWILSKRMQQTWEKDNTAPETRLGCRPDLLSGLWQRGGLLAFAGCCHYCTTQASAHAAPASTHPLKPWQHTARLWSRWLMKILTGCCV